MKERSCSILLTSQYLRDLEAERPFWLSVQHYSNYLGFAMDREAVEKFIDLQDKENDIDTAGKLSRGSHDGKSVYSVDSRGSNDMSPTSAGGFVRNKNMQLQLTPTKVAASNTVDSHPLNDNTSKSEENEDVVLSLPSKSTLKINGGGSTVENSKGADQGLGIRRNNTWKRKSLIMPLMSPEHTPKHQHQPHKHSESATDTPLGRKYRSTLEPNSEQRSVRSSVGSIGSLLPDGVTLESTANPAVRIESVTATSMDDGYGSPGKNGDVETLLQSLANKELEILERTRRVHDLFRQIKVEDRIIQQDVEQLQQLKKKVSRLVGDQINGRNGDAQQSELGGAGSDLGADSKKPSSLWTKSVSLLNQFDQIIQGTAETKLGLAGPGNDNDGVQPEDKKKVDENAGNTIWSLVNEFKHGFSLLTGEDEEQEEESDRPTKNGFSSATTDADGQEAKVSLSRTMGTSSPKEIEMYHYNH
ncbi:unnamed protein product [Kluyveromyces dobzhanskii CBS 2104]|uniref:Topoisomerase I damage affected protein 11 n=1 Tax=Kluyveromyces dobzhanskii CBS 2104 TaxID=1427455 RepID=A0A0A8L992_9SACH|nr:unnamed protein product [Kluyveromyces dobzhanskii CBS 2104]